MTQPPQTTAVMMNTANLETLACIKRSEEIQSRLEAEKARLNHRLKEQYELHSHDHDDDESDHEIPNPEQEEEEQQQHDENCCNATAKTDSCTSTPSSSFASSSSNSSSASCTNASAAKAAAAAVLDETNSTCSVSDNDNSERSQRSDKGTAATTTTTSTRRRNANRCNDGTTKPPRGGRSPVRSPAKSPVRSTRSGPGGGGRSPVRPPARSPVRSTPRGRPGGQRSPIRSNTTTGRRRGGTKSPVRSPTRETKKKVRWYPFNQTNLIESHDDFTLREMRKYWWTAFEINEMRPTYRTAKKLFQHCTKKECCRGLEVAYWSLRVMKDNEFGDENDDALQEFVAEFIAPPSPYVLKNLHETNVEKNTRTKKMYRNYVTYSQQRARILALMDEAFVMEHIYDLSYSDSNFGLSQDDRWTNVRGCTCHSNELKKLTESNHKSMFGKLGKNVARGVRRAVSGGMIRKRRSSTNNLPNTSAGELVVQET